MVIKAMLFQTDDTDEARAFNRAKLAEEVVGVSCLGVFHYLPHVIPARDRETINRIVNAPHPHLVIRSIELYANHVCNIFIGMPGAACPFGILKYIPNKKETK